MNDIVERLNEAAKNPWTGQDFARFLRIAAGEIVRLREENERLKQAAVAFESRCNQHRLFAEAAGAERDRLRDALKRVLAWAEAVAGDNRFVAEAAEEVASVEQARAALGDKP